MRPVTGFVALLTLVALAVALAATTTAEEERLNVLFIAVDDLRPELGAYGHPHVMSPNIDRLAAEGTLFTRAYCQQAVCNPSRASLMTGLRPDTLQVYDLPTHFRDQQPDAVTIPQHFKAHGYHTERVGKIFHLGHGNRDDPLSWTRMKEYPSAPRYGPEGEALRAQVQRAARKQGVDLAERRNQPRGLPWEAPDVADDDLADGAIAAAAVQILREVRDRPFFLAVGFLNPHLPFVAPKKYWDQYDPADIALPENLDPPQGAPTYAATDWGELRRYHNMPQRGPLSNAQAREAIHGYWAATSYVDALVGKLVAELDRLELREKTVVILWGDHGWQLGEHGFWCKHTNYEVAARAPLIISVPGQPNTGAKSNALVEFVDIFPSLADASGLPVPEGLDGLSFAPLIEDPQRSWKTAAFHLYPRNIPDQGRGMGHAIKTDRYRLVEWRVPNKDFVEHELYDHNRDPNENLNVAGRPEYAEVVKELSGRLQKGWRGELPRE
ncbi:MAG: sulfatase-like hydrolase/transferase [Luteitalea sp.]|nr:sulfatase-like hydrolase/transferase [Luteitalea sp.]